MGEASTETRTIQGGGVRLKSGSETLEHRGGDAVLSESALERVYLFCLSTRQSLASTFGDIESGLILMVADWAGIGGHPTDISTISEITGISRPTIRRKLERLERRGFVEVSRRPNRTLVLPQPEKRGEIRQSMSQIAKAMLGTAHRMDSEG